MSIPACKLTFPLLQAGDLEAEGMNDLITELQKHTYLPKRNPDGPFIFSVDHCFSLCGQGTVLTGTVISGSVAVNDVSSRLCRTEKQKV